MPTGVFGPDSTAERAAWVAEAGGGAEAGASGGATG